MCRSVLVFEHEVNHAKSIMDTVSSVGGIPFWCRKVENMQRMLDERQFAVVTIDISTDKSDRGNKRGREVFNLVESHDANIRRVAWTGTGSEDEATIVLKTLGGTHYVSKLDSTQIKEGKLLQQFDEFFSLKFGISAPHEVPWVESVAGVAAIQPLGQSRLLSLFEVASSDDLLDWCRGSWCDPARGMTAQRLEGLLGLALQPTFAFDGGDFLLAELDRRPGTGAVWCQHWSYLFGCGVAVGVGLLKDVKDELQKADRAESWLRIPLRKIQLPERFRCEQRGDGQDANALGIVRILLDATYEEFAGKSSGRDGRSNSIRASASPA